MLLCLYKKNYNFLTFNILKISTQQIILTDIKFSSLKALAYKISPLKSHYHLEYAMFLSSLHRFTFFHCTGT